MSDLKKLLEAVTEMRAAQKLEWDALPSNFRVWKRARQQQRVSQLEEQVDALVRELRRAYPETDEDAGEDPKGSKTLGV